MVMLAFGYQQTLAPEIRTGTGLDYAAISRHVSVIAKRPHPIGSAANREVRDYVVAYFESLGLETGVQKTTVVYRHPNRPGHATVIGFVENIIARLPGDLQTAVDGPNDLVVMGHYDSRPLTPGAGDDASATASIMEVARIMATGPAPAHDVIFLITDGEEMGLLGAQGFFRQHPAAQRVGLVLNFEARGSYGASSMFETSSDNAWLIDGLIESTPDLLASSLSYEIYRRMPNDTDMSISKGEGIPGLNFAFVAGLFDYHAMTDSVENLDVNTLAHQANYVLATTQYFANLENWRSAEGEPTYFNLWQGTLVSYSQNLAVVFGLVVLLLGMWLFFSALRTGTVAWSSTGTGVLGVFIIFLMVYSAFENLIAYLQKADAGIMRLTSLGEWPFLAFFITSLGLTLWFANRLRRGLGKIDIFVPALVLVALSLVAGRYSVIAFVPPLLLIPLMMVASKRISQPDIWTAALWIWCLLTAVVLYFAPNASYLFVWPLASVLLGITLRRSLPRINGGTTQFVSLLVFSFVPLLLLAPIYIMFYVALGLVLPQILMIFCVLSLLLIWPLIRSIGFVADGKAGLLIFIVGLVMTAVVLLGRGFDTRHPRGEELFYAIDVGQQQGFWVSSDARPGSWLGEFLGDQATVSNMTRIMPGYDQEILTRESDLPAYQAAKMTVNRDHLVNGMREISFHLQPAVAGEYINLLFATDSGISGATVNGFPVKMPDGDTDLESSSWWRWRLYGVAEEGADISVTVAAGKPVSIKIVGVGYELPDGAPARPENSMRRKYTWSDSVVIFQTVILE
jgi:hypothetical protein